MSTEGCTPSSGRRSCPQRRVNIHTYRCFVWLDSMLMAEAAFISSTFLRVCSPKRVTTSQTRALGTEDSDGECQSFPQFADVKKTARPVRKVNNHTGFAVLETVSTVCETLVTFSAKCAEMTNKVCVSGQTTKRGRRLEGAPEELKSALSIRAVLLLGALGDLMRPPPGARTRFLSSTAVSWASSRIPYFTLRGPVLATASLGRRPPSATFAFTNKT